MSEESIFGSVSSIGEGAFFGSGITEFVVSDDITSIEAFAFSECVNLTLVTLSQNLTTIGEGAFSKCTSLITITLPPTLETITTNAFSDCTGLTTIIFQGRVTIEPDAFTNSPLSVETVISMLSYYSDAELLDMGINQSTITAACFSEDTNILCLNLDSKEEYIPVKNLKKGDLVKTYLHGYRKINIMCKGILKNNISKFRDCMYKMKKTDENGLIEDLIITGGHSIMVDELTKEEHDITARIWKLDQVDNKYLLMAGISDKFEQIQGDKIFKYYHFSLENDGNPDNRYGVFANGVLVETPSETDIKTFKTVVFI